MSGPAGRAPDTLLGYPVVFVDDVDMWPYSEIVFSDWREGVPLPDDVKFAMLEWWNRQLDDMVQARDCGRLNRGTDKPLDMNLTPFGHVLLLESWNPTYDDYEFRDTAGNKWLGVLSCGRPSRCDLCAGEYGEGWLRVGNEVGICAACAVTVCLQVDTYDYSREAMAAVCNDGG